MKTSLDVKNHVNLCGIKKRSSKTGSFGGEKNYVCISEESVSCGPLSDKEIQRESHNESYPKSRRHVKTIYDTQKEETEWQH